MADTMENGFKKVLIVCNYNKEGAGRIAMDMEKYLMERDYSVTVIRNSQDIGWRRCSACGCKKSGSL